MIFSTRIRKLGKGEILNGFVKRDKRVTLYYSKGDVVYSRTISLQGTLAKDEYKQISADEVLPITDSFSLVRTGETIRADF